jgi:hypothetical protein
VTSYVIRGEYPAYTLTADGTHVTHATQLRPLMCSLANEIQPGDTITWQPHPEGANQP